MSDSSDGGCCGCGGGIGLPGAVFLVFLILKLCGVLEWSWIWVTAPLWIPAGITAVVLVVMALVVGVSMLIAIWVG